jgi:hypothetical protein
MTDYSRLNGATDGAGKALGLGLSLVKQFPTAEVIFLIVAGFLRPSYGSGK